jgi:hypothetical protein
MKRETCDYDVPWCGLCLRRATSAGRCDEHRHLICSVCRQPASRGCDVAHVLVCGAPLCGDDRCAAEHAQVHR